MALIKALRAYHRPGCWCPSKWTHTPDTGRPRRRNWRTPLSSRRSASEAIRQVLDAGDPAVTRKILTDHGAVLEDRLAETQRAVDDLYAALETPALRAPVHRRHEPARTVLTFAGTVAETEWAPLLDQARSSITTVTTTTWKTQTGTSGHGPPTCCPMTSPRP